jgi:hypothetical protein
MRKMMTRSQYVALGDGNGIEAASAQSFDVIASTYKKLRRLQDQSRSNCNPIIKNCQKRSRASFDKLEHEVIDEVKSLSLNASRIEALVEQLYTINKRLVTLETQLYCAWPRRRVYRARISSSNIRAMNMRPIGRAAWPLDG